MSNLYVRFKEYRQWPYFLLRMQWHIEAVWETSILTWIPKLWCPKSIFQVLFFQLHFNKKHVEVAIINFTMHLIISKWLGWQNANRWEKQCDKKMLMRKRKPSVKVFSFILICKRSRKCSIFLLDFFTKLLPFIKWYKNAVCSVGFLIDLCGTIEKNL